MISNTNLDDNSHRKYDLKRPQKIELTDSTVNRTTNKNSKLKTGYIHAIGENNDEYLEEIVQINNL